MRGNHEHIHRRAGELTFAEVARRMGLSHLSPRAQVTNLRRLADREGMPIPKNPRWRGGREARFADRIGRRSVWDAEKFQQWQDDRDEDRPRPGDRAPRANVSLEAALAARAQREDT